MAMNVANFQAVKLQGCMMGRWSTSVCPWLYNSKKDAVKERAVVEFLNQGGIWADEVIACKPGMSVLPKLHNCMWLHTGNTLICPKTGTNITDCIAPGFCKPDMVLMDSMRPTGSIEWTNIILVLEIKYCNTRNLTDEVTNYMLEIAQLVLTNQLNQQYFIGLLLLGAKLFMCIYTHGGLSITTLINIYHVLSPHGHTFSLALASTNWSTKQRQ
ncbi:hypothetical protein EDB19DRAFT_1833368 [Suillus lakei]|nr:hypothetical protein EDB19DRAFT_1833368 [Suillus lakei]